jgi:hypothetical protein
VTPLNIMLATASIQDTTTTTRLARLAPFRRLPGLCGRFVVSPRLDPRFRGDDTRWSRYNSCFAASPFCFGGRSRYHLDGRDHSDSAAIGFMEAVSPPPASESIQGL